MAGKQKKNITADLFELAPQAMVLLNSVGQIIRFNQCFSALFGYQPAELNAQAITLVLPTYQLSHPANASQDSPIFVLDLAGKHKDNRNIPLKVTGKALTTGEGAHLLLSLCEIGGDRQAEVAPNPLHYHLIEWWVNERRRLAQQIHQGALQEIQGLNFFLAALAGAPDLSNEVTHELILMRDSVQRLTQEVRSLQQEIFPPPLTDFGVAATIRSYTKHLQALYPTLKIQLKLAEDNAQLPLTLAATLFYSCKQALLHLIQPLAVHEVQIKLQIDAETVMLEIFDNGDGFDVPEQWITITHQKDLGLVSAIKCAEALGGQCETRAAPAKGSMLCMTIPIASQP
ncbi:MAG: PAS domain S-box protein [Caldilineaceae bacterium]